jgi:predicted aspartyl protease
LSLPIIARLRPGATPGGEPQAGVLGSDLVSQGSLLDLDLVRQTLFWYAPAQPAPALPKNAVVLPIEYRNGWLVASGIRLEGRDVKLVVDTGASNVIVVGKTPRLNEVREDTVDGTATGITLWHGDGEISFAGGTVRHVPIDRTDAFATLEGLIAELGGDVEGLLGLTALGRERVILGRESMTIVLPPVAPSPL